MRELGQTHRDEVNLSSDYRNGLESNIFGKVSHTKDENLPCVCVWGGGGSSNHRKD